MAQQTTQTKARQAQRIWRAFLNGLSVAAVLVLLAMMLLTSADVIARYLFNRPISGAFELTEIFLATLVFLAMPLTTATDGHIRADLLPIRTGSALSVALGFLAMIIVAGIFSAMAWEVWEHAQKLYKRGTVTNSLSIPLFFVARLVSVSCAISAVAAVVYNAGNTRS